jgi:hypothetical protein
VNKGKLNIRDMRVRAVAAPMRRPLTTSTGSVSIAPLLLLDLHTDGGITGRAYLFGIGTHNLAPIAKIVQAMHSNRARRILPRRGAPASPRSSCPRGPRSSRPKSVTVFMSRVPVTLLTDASFVGTTPLLCSQATS